MAGESAAQTATRAAEQVGTPAKPGSQSSVEQMQVFVAREKQQC
jgi:hypothetical protein